MNLHSFSSRGSGVCRSLFFRTFMVMMLFITGSNGIYAGEDLKATIGTPASDGKWDGSTGTYSWTQAYNNLMPLFNNLQGKLGVEYTALKFNTSEFTPSVSDGEYRVCFRYGDKFKNVTFKKAGNINLVFSECPDLKDIDLTQVYNISFGGNCKSGSIVLDKESIYLVGKPAESGAVINTGIENLLFESGILTHSADVYSIDGRLVRSKALNLNGLPKGIYIVNGKKYVKK